MNVTSLPLKRSRRQSCNPVEFDGITSAPVDRRQIPRGANPIEFDGIGKKVHAS